MTYFSKCGHGSLVKMTKEKILVSKLDQAIAKISLQNLKKANEIL